MPIDKGVGYGDHTQLKQDDFLGLLSLHIKIVDGITSKAKNSWQRYYTYIDMNAGPGIYNGIVGSPMLFLSQIEQTTIPYQATFIEQEQCNADQLSNLIGQRSPRGKVSVVNGSNEHALRNGSAPTKKTFGMIYHDPNGMPNFDLLSEVSRNQCFQHMDFVIYLGATTIKRVRRAEEVAGSDTKAKLLADYLGSINKATWIIRKPAGRNQWTFAIGSNWVNFPTWQKHGFYKIDSEEGESILKRLTYTNGEIDDMGGQMSFFN